MISLGGPKILKRFVKARTKLAAGPLAWPLGGIVSYFAVNTGTWEKGVPGLISGKGQRATVSLGFLGVLAIKSTGVGPNKTHPAGERTRAMANWLYLDIVRLGSL
ncbi:MAG: hypothetical protein LBL95_08735 [Deltaproteobacteria bacterium]|jgi:hypothetical protein|nr:hypothetical protein [Deltaproteobacteria bacterium]